MGPAGRWNGTHDFVGRRLNPGTIALQGHDPNSTVYYKNIRIKPLDSSVIPAEARRPDRAASRDAPE